MSGLQDGFRVAGQSTPRIRQIALNTREALDMGDGRMPLGRLLERFHTFGITLDVFDASSAPVGHNVEACWVPESTTLYVRDHVYTDACRGGTRATFTISHELGHMMLGHRRTQNRQRPGPIPPYENSEWQANTFASEFSMPLPVIVKRHLWTPGAIADHFGVSIKAAEVRIEKLRRSRE